MNRAERRWLKGAPGVMQHLARPNCSLCSGAVEWMGLGDAVDSFGADRVNLFLDALEIELSDDSEIDFWRCRKCGQTGAMAAPEAG